MKKMAFAVAAAFASIGFSASALAILALITAPAFAWEPTNIASDGISPQTIFVSPPVAIVWGSPPMSPGRPYALGGVSMCFIRMHGDWKP